MEDEELAVEAPEVEMASQDDQEDKSLPAAAQIEGEGSADQEEEAKAQ